MAAQVTSDHPELADGYVGGATTAVHNQALLAAVQHLLYSQLRLRHEPIEWLYDGLAPLLPCAAIQQRKAAPLTLAVLASSVCARLGVLALPLRASPAAPPRTTQQLAVEEGYTLPQDVALRQAGRPAAYIPNEPWLVAIARSAAAVDMPINHIQQPLNVHLPGGVGWQLSGTFLDVSVRGGRVLSEAEVRATYPLALPSLQAKLVRAADVRAYVWGGCSWSARVMNVWAPCCVTQLYLNRLMMGNEE
jgi:hypothetical protein